MEFNQNTGNIIHLDINSCFATIEQQANPLLRDKPVVVCAYTTNSGCILAASVTAKKLGIKTGMKVIDAKRIYPKVVVLEPDPPKYRFVHKKIFKILENYSLKVIPKSIDEFVFKILDGFDPILVSKEIKRRIKKEVGEYITVSIGISTNRYLAKVASNLQKPDGLSLINKDNFREVFSRLKLTDLTGIKNGNSTRLNLVGIKTVLDFYNSPLNKLKLAFGGIGGYYWYLRLKGYEIDNYQSIRKTYSNSFAPPPNMANDTFKILSKLTQKTGLRIRKAGFKISGVHLFLQNRDGFTWHMGRKLKKDIFDSNDLFLEFKKLVGMSPIKNNLRNIAISTFGIKDKRMLQTEIFSDVVRKEILNKSLDMINTKFGEYTIYPARMINGNSMIKDRIAFGQ
jgi:DNA polymerase-4